MVPVLLSEFLLSQFLKEFSANCRNNHFSVREAQKPSERTSATVQPCSAAAAHMRRIRLTSVVSHDVPAAGSVD